MPLYLNDEFQHRIELNGSPIRRVYDGNNNLRYGLYDVYYYELDQTPSYDPKRYVGGDKTISALHTFTDKFDTYLMHANGWLESGALKTEIDIDDHKDMKLYADGQQKHFMYSGEGATKKGYDDAPAYGTDAAILIATSEGIYYDQDPIYTYLQGECTGYANGRTAAMRGNNTTGHAPKGGFAGGNANTWDTSCGGNGSALTDPSNPSGVQVGDVVVFDNSTTGHVAVIEAIDGSTNTFTLSDYNGRGGYKLSGGLFSGTFGSAYPTDPSTTYKSIIMNHTDKVKTGGETGTVDGTECSDQENPQHEDPPKGEWTSYEKKTEIRHYDYSSTNGGSGNGFSDDGDLINWEV